MRRLYQRFHDKKQESKRNYFVEKGFVSIKSTWELLLGRLKHDCQVHENHAAEYTQIIVPRLAQSDEFVARVTRRSADIGTRYHAELEDQMKKLER